MDHDFSHLKAGIYLANPMTGATKSITSGEDWTRLFGFSDKGNASVSTIAATVAWVYSALEERRKTLGQIKYTWELKGEPIEDSKLPFEFKTMVYALRADKAIQLVANAYLWKWRNKAGTKLFKLRWLDPRAVTPDDMRVEAGVGYTNYKYNETSVRGAGQRDIPADDIIRTFVEGLNELDPDSSAAMAYNLAAQIIWGMEETTDSFYDTNGLPVMLVTVAPGSSKQAQDDTQSAFKRAFQRRRDGRGSKVIAIPNTVTVEKLSFTPADLAQAELSEREIASIYAVMSIPLEFLNKSGDRAKAEQATRTLVLTMAARFKLLADELNADPEIKEDGLFLRILVQDHPTMKRDMGLVFEAVNKATSSGMTLKAALFFNGVSVDDLPDDIQLQAEIEQQEEETAVIPAVVEKEDTSNKKAAELAQLKNFVSKGTHKKRPFSAVYLPRETVKAEITAADEADIAQLNADLQALIEQAAIGEIDESAFKAAYLALFLPALRAAAASGASGDMTEAGNVQLLELEAQAVASTDELATEIYAGRYSTGGINPLTPNAEPFNPASAGQTAETAVSKIVNRVALWGASIVGAFAIGQVFSEENSELKLMWVVGATDHCPDCLRLNGQVHTAEEWAGVIQPQSPELFCKGYNCQCNLVEVPSDTPTSGGF